MAEKTLRHRCLEALIKPLVNYCLRHGHTYQELATVARKAFVERASETLRQRGEKVNTSRLSVVTGLNRNEVARLNKKSSERSYPTESIAARVMSHWETAPEFLDGRGKPKKLSFEGNSSEFSHLVEAVSKHVHPGTVLFDLIRTDSVKKTKNGLRLTATAHGIGDDTLQGYELLSNNMDALILAVEENIENKPHPSNLPSMTILMKRKSQKLDTGSSKKGPHSIKKLDAF